MLCNTHTLKPVLTAQAENSPLKAPASGLLKSSICLPMATLFSNCTRAGRGFLSATLRGAIEEAAELLSANKPMPKPFYKHKTLLDEHLYHRRQYPLLNAHFDVKHLRDDLHLDGLPDPAIYELAVKQGRIHSYQKRQRFSPPPSGRLPRYHRHSGSLVYPTALIANSPPSSCNTAPTTSAVATVLSPQKTRQSQAA